MHKGTRDLRVPSVACQASRVSAMNWPEFVKGDLEKNHVGIIPAFRTTTEKKTLSSKTKKNQQHINAFNIQPSRHNNNRSDNQVQRRKQDPAFHTGKRG